MRVRHSEPREAYARIQLYLIVSLIIAVALAVALPQARAAGDPFDATIQHDFAFAAQQLERTARTIPTNRYPSTTNSSGAWDTTGPSTWTSGFFPGALWLMYERTNDNLWRTRAET